MAKPGTSFWQSYADLGMGLMAVFALILLLMLVKEQSRKQDLADTQRRFTARLQRILKAGQAIVRQQDAVQHWLAGLFQQGTCGLVLNNGKLEVRGAKTATLYESASVELDKKALHELKKCKENFFYLARCLSADDRGHKDCLGFYPQPAHRIATIRTFREGVEALVLQGNTDRALYVGSKRDDVPIIRSVRSNTYRAHRELRRFVNNAHLGSERARQALAYLLYLVGSKKEEENPSSAVQVLMRHIRIESPSFGRYQSGPVKKRVPGCVLGKQSCSNARNLSLVIRWRKDALRKPYQQFHSQMCSLLQSERSEFYRGLSKRAAAKQAQEWTKLCARQRFK